jgi:hypothetical protein
MKTVRHLLVAAALLALAAPAHAGSITLFGATFTVTNLGLVNPLDTDGSYQFRLDVDTTGYTPPTQNPFTQVSGTDHLSAFAFDFDVNVASFTAPTGWIGDTGQLNNTCDSGPNTFLCFETALTTTQMNGTSTYQFLFTVDFDGDLANAPPTDLGLEVQVTGTRIRPSNGNTQVQKFNANGDVTAAYTPPDPNDPPPTAVPEPGSLLLLGSGLVLAASRMRRRIVGK